MTAWIDDDERISELALLERLLIERRRPVPPPPDPRVAMLRAVLHLLAEATDRGCR